MAIEIKFTIDDDFTEDDLKAMMDYRHTWCAIYNIKQHVHSLWRGKTDHSNMDKQKLLDHLHAYIAEETSDLVDLD